MKWNLALHMGLCLVSTQPFEQLLRVESYHDYSNYLVHAFRCEAVPRIFDSGACITVLSFRKTPVFGFHVRLGEGMFKCEAKLCKS